LIELLSRFDPRLEEALPSQIREYKGIGHRNCDNLAWRRIRRGASSLRRTTRLARPSSSASQRGITSFFSIQLRVGGVLYHRGGFSARTSGGGLPIPCTNTVSVGSTSNSSSTSRRILGGAVRLFRDAESAKDLQNKDYPRKSSYQSGSQNQAPLSEKTSRVGSGKPHKPTTRIFCR
jgi:hypothetical protein